MAIRRGPILIISSLLLAVGAAWVANNWLQARAAGASSAEGKTMVVVAALEIPFGTKIEARHLGSIEMLSTSVPQGAFSEAAEVVGKVARSAILRGEFIIKGRLADNDAGSALAAVVERHMRAVTVRVDDVVGVGGFLLPGNRVDVLASRRVHEEATTETILSDIKVLAVDQTASTDENKPVVVRAVTLEVTPEQAEILIKGKEAGSIQLTLRNPGDNSVYVTRKAPVLAPTLLVKDAPPPVKKAPQGPQLTIIRGTQIEHR